MLLSIALEIFQTFLFCNFFLTFPEKVYIS